MNKTNQINQTNNHQSQLNITSNIKEDVYIVVACSDLPFDEPSSDGIINNMIANLKEEHILRGYKKKEIPLMCNEGNTKQLTIFNSNKYILWHGYIPTSNVIILEYSTAGIQIRSGSQILPNIRVCGALDSKKNTYMSTSFIIILIIVLSILILLAIMYLKSKKNN